MHQHDLKAVILAAGQGKRMHAEKSKVLCEVGFKPLLNWIIDAARSAGIENICVVASSDDVVEAAAGCTIAFQKERLGTGHAVMCAREFLEGGHTLVLNGDAPFIDQKTITDALQHHLDADNDVTVISAEIESPNGYGRILRNKDGAFEGILEDADCLPEHRAIREINSGGMWYKTDSLNSALVGIRNSNRQHEYYLTDAITVLRHQDKRVDCFTAGNPDIVLGANSPADLLLLNEIATKNAIARHLENGVRFISRDGIVIGPDVRIGAGTTILPGTLLIGKTVIGAGSTIGPNSVLTDTVVGDNTVINACQCTESRVGNGATLGPYTQLRPDSVIGDGAKIGDFVEIKNSTVGDGTSVAHLTYVGDADVGKHCNFGCGIVFVNYDGEKKSRTVVGDYAFIGCNVNLVAPVEIGEAAYVAAGTTVTRPVPAGALAIGRADQTIKEKWAEKKLETYLLKKKKK